MPRTIDYALVVPMADDPDVVVAHLGDNAHWDTFTELAEAEHRRLMRDDATYRRHITRARTLWLRETAS